MKLPVITLVAESYRTVFHRPWRLIMAMILPLLLIVAIGLASLPWRDPPTWAGAVSPIVDILPYLFFGLIWFRLLLGSPFEGTLPWPLFGPRSLVYFTYALILYLLCVMPAVVFVGPAFVALLEGLRSGEYGFLTLSVLAHLLLPVCLLAWGCLLARFSLLLPSAAIDERLSWGSAWRATAGNSLRLPTAYLLAILPIFLLLTTVAFVAIQQGHWSEPGLRAGAGEFWFLQSTIITLAIAVLRLSMVAILATIAAETYRRVPGGMNAQGQVRMRFE